MGLDSSPEQPLPVRTVARAIGSWVGRLGRVWVEGQVTELSRRPGAATAFLVLRDPVADLSLRVTCGRDVLDGCEPPLTEGARVVVWAKPEFYLPRGTLSLVAHDLRPVGLGALLARLQQLKKVLAAEGLFAPERKRALPFLPTVVGLVTGRASAAEHDVVENATRRWPAVRFRVENVAVQGPYAVTQVIEALRVLDADPQVDVIVVARGGGGVEDLLAFSDEALCRAVAACRTPVVSAIGHETDTPLLDFVADRRASTPTDAGKLVVPDVGEETERLQALVARGRRCLAARLDPQPVLALRDRARRCLAARLEREGAEVHHTTARLRALSPAATLERGYAVVQRPDGTVVRDAAQVAVGERLRARLASGRLDVDVAGRDG